MLFEKLLEVLDPEPHAAALNMAIDEVLLRAAERPMLRVYRWERPAISIGYFEKWAALPNPVAGVEIVRRWTGGGVVEHGADVTYTLIIPPEHELARVSAAESYRRIHDRVAALLGEQGTVAQLAGATAEKISSGCFENPAEADILAEGRKVAGAAQRRTRWGLLHQGSVQGLALAPDFAERLAATFAAHSERRLLSGDEVAAARSLAAEKYATEAWLRRF